MNRPDTYEKPQITVVEIAVEKGFADSLLPPGKLPEGWD